ncbi:hypothetical protein K474DRAFT_1667121 [Panus rudis PR-1116 ss-1]|nr:hypothetical protein K474DRAFT_1667121 [Panus rudis PR-1116 ss-1]
MRTSLEKAVSSVLEAKQSITLSNVWAAYLLIAGYSPTRTIDDPNLIGSPLDAINAFEHALEKHPAISPPRRARRKDTEVPPPSVATPRMYMNEIERIREEYWKERQSAEQKGCTCGKCGQLIKVQADQLTKLTPEYPKRRSVKKRKTKKRISNSTSSSESDSSLDPYGPSTSSFLL